MWKYVWKCYVETFVMRFRRVRGNIMGPSEAPVPREAHAGVVGRRLRWSHVFPWLFKTHFSVSVKCISHILLVLLRGSNWIEEASVLFSCCRRFFQHLNAMLWCVLQHTREGLFCTAFEYVRFGACTALLVDTWGFVGAKMGLVTELSKVHRDQKRRRQMQWMTSNSDVQCHFLNSTSLHLLYFSVTWIWKYWVPAAN